MNVEQIANFRYPPHQPDEHQLLVPLSSDVADASTRADASLGLWDGALPVTGSHASAVAPVSLSRRSDGERLRRADQ